MSYFGNLIIGPVEKPVFKHTPIYAAIQQATGWLAGRPNLADEHAVGVDYADIAAEYIATMILGG